jgi:hypothetical protein
VEEEDVSARKRTSEVLGVASEEFTPPNAYSERTDSPVWCASAST